MLLFNPTQLFIQGQWWSILMLQLPHCLQWLVRIGFQVSSEVVESDKTVSILQLVQQLTFLYKSFSILCYFLSSGGCFLIKNIFLLSFYPLNSYIFGRYCIKITEHSYYITKKHKSNISIKFKFIVFHFIMKILLILFIFNFLNTNNPRITQFVGIMQVKHIMKFLPLIQLRIAFLLGFSSFNS